MILSLGEILKCVSGKLLVAGTQDKFNKISIDTRKMYDSEIYLAINGKNFDGNRYVFEAIENGAKLCVVDREYYNLSEFENIDCSIILVDDTLKALKNMAILVRSKLNIDIIAVTGSVGKTTTKDIIYDFLVSKYRVYKVQGNLNNHLGMPISLINIDDECEIGVFELGMSGFGEIDYLVNILRPNIGVITNIAENHIEFLHTFENILKAKMELINYFDENSVLVLNNEDELLRSVVCNFKTFRIGLKDDCDLYAHDIVLNSDFTRFKFVYSGKIEEITLPLLGKHNILNILIALKICEIFNISIDLVKNRYKFLSISSMRQEIIPYKDMIIINDCYNAGPRSMKSSIDVLNLYTGRTRLCVLGDMAELGDKTKYYHNDISKYLNDRVDKLIAIGKYRYEYARYFKKFENCFCFENITDFENQLKDIISGDEVVLIKASRASKFEKVREIIEKNF